MINPVRAGRLAIRHLAASVLRSAAARLDAPPAYTSAALSTSGGVVVRPWAEAEWRLGLVVFAFWWDRAGLSWRELARQHGTGWRTAYDICSRWMAEVGVVIVQPRHPARWSYWLSEDGQQYGEWDYPRFRRYVRLDRFGPTTDAQGRVISPGLPYPSAPCPACLRTPAQRTHSTAARWTLALRGAVPVDAQ